MLFVPINFAASFPFIHGFAWFLLLFFFCCFYLFIYFFLQVMGANLNPRWPRGPFWVFRGGCGIGAPTF